MFSFSEKLRANIISNGYILNALPLKSGARQGPSLSLKIVLCKNEMEGLKMGVTTSLAEPIPESAKIIDKMTSILYYTIGW